MNRKIGPTRRFASDHMVYDMLTRAGTNLEAKNIVEHAMVRNAPCMVDLDLTDGQYAQLPLRRRK